MTGPISPQNHALIEHTRKVNKTLSLFVFALQENSSLPIETQVGIADILGELADTIRDRAAQQGAGGSGNTTLSLDRAATRLQIEARCTPADRSYQLPSGRCS